MLVTTVILGVTIGGAASILALVAGKGLLAALLYHALFGLLGLALALAFGLGVLLRWAKPRVPLSQSRRLRLD